MNKLIIIAITSMLLAGSGVVLARDGFGGPGHKGQRGGPFMPLSNRFMHAVNQLDLSDTQKENIHNTMQAMKSNIEPIMAEMRAVHLQLQELIKADEFDENTVSGLSAKEGDLAAERILITSRALSDVYAQLTEEQRTELEEMRAQRMERRAQRQQQQTGDCQNF